MNTIGSVYYGWAFLILCGGGSYYFAKRSINADRYERQATENERRMRQSRLPSSPPRIHTVSEDIAEKSTDKVSRTKPANKKDGREQSLNPSVAASTDPAPTDCAPGDLANHEESKFETSRPFRSRKGDRFS